MSGLMLAGGRWEGMLRSTSLVAAFTVYVGLRDRTADL